MALSLKTIFHDNMFPLRSLAMRNPFEESFFGCRDLAPDNFFNRNPFADMETTFANLRESMPSVDVEETENALTLRAELPELKEGDVSIRLDDNVLTVSGEKKVVSSNEENGVKSHRSHYESFTRRLPVPKGTTEEDIKAQYVNNVLQVEVKKKALEGTEARTIPIEYQDKQQDAAEQAIQDA